MLSTNETLKHLNLSKCNLSDLHLWSITEGMKNNLTLETLDLSCNESPKNYREFSKMLAYHPLKELNLSYNSINDKDGVFIA